MVAHLFPQPLATLKSGLGRAAGGEGAQGVSPLGWQRGLPLDEGRDGPVCVPLHAASRCQGSRLGAGAVSRRAGARRLRRLVLLSGPRPAGARRRRQCAIDGDRGADGGLAALFGSARAIFAGALRHQRDAEDRRRGPRSAHRDIESPCGDSGHGVVRRSRPQIPDLGARPLSQRIRRGHRESPCLQASAGHPDGGGEKTARSAGRMTGSDSHAVAGGPARHIPVLARRTVEWLGVRDGGLYVDATFGAGGYTQEILATPGTRVIGIDRDQSAIARGAGLVEQAQGRLDLVEDRFSNLEAIVGGSGTVDGIVFDVGVSSMQIDDAARGFSFRLDGPLDMRMGNDGPSAADIVARAGERELGLIIATLGEERHARAVARAIVKARGEHAISTTRALAEIVARVVHSRDSAIHPATRTFQGLRIFVNDELGELARGLAAAERVLKPSGRLVVVAFHSLEDRIVKTFLTERSRAPAGSRHQPELVSAAPSFRVLTRRPETPDEAEIAANPRARSAKLRAAERIEAPPHSAAIDHLLPRLPSPTDVMRGRP